MLCQLLGNISYISKHLQVIYVLATLTIFSTFNYVHTLSEHIFKTEILMLMFSIFCSAPFFLGS
jgi:hypothetical protein